MAFILANAFFCLSINDNFFSSFFLELNNSSTGDGSCLDLPVAVGADLLDISGFLFSCKDEFFVFDCKFFNFGVFVKFGGASTCYVSN